MNFSANPWTSYIGVEQKSMWRVEKQKRVGEWSSEWELRISGWGHIPNNESVYFSRATISNLSLTLWV